MTRYDRLKELLLKSKKLEEEFNEALDSFKRKKKNIELEECIECSKEIIRLVNISMEEI